MADLVEVFRSESTVEAQLLAQRLRDHGIVIALLGEHQAAQMGMAPFIAPCRVMVREDQLAEAQAAIAVMAAADAAPAAPGPEACPACHEPWEAGFQECWNCQEPLPA